MVYYKKNSSAYSMNRLPINNECSKMHEENEEMREEIEILKSELYEKNKSLKEKNSQIELLSEKVEDLVETLVYLKDENSEKSMMVDHLNVCLNTRRARAGLTDRRNDYFERNFKSMKRSFLIAKENYIKREQEHGKRQEILEKHIDELNNYVGYLEDKLLSCVGSDCQGVKSWEILQTFESDQMLNMECDNRENEDSGCEDCKTDSMSESNTDSECGTNHETVQAKTTVREVITASKTECENKSVIISAKVLKTEENSLSKQFKNCAKNQKKRKVLYKKMFTFAML